MMQIILMGPLMSPWQKNLGEILTLKAGDVHLWRAFFNRTALDELNLLLTDEERTRTQRLVKESDQQKNIFAIGTLRKILSRYLHVPPHAVRFSVGAHGKPYISEHALEFNVSHSGNYLLIGVTLQQAIGVDVEYVRYDQDYLSLAKRFFLPTELLAIQNATQPRHAFYHCWTRKEAFIKAIGIGLSFGLNNLEVDVSDVSAEKSCLLSVKNENRVDWSVRSVSLDEQSKCSAAFCVQGEVQHIFYWQWG